MRTPLHQPFNPKDLHVFATVSNPMNYNSRIELFKEFEKEMLDYGVTLWVVEVIYGDITPSICNRNNPNHLIIRAGDTGRTAAPIWTKESSYNCLVAYAFAKSETPIKYLAFFDSDISFAGRSDWPVEIIRKLQYHEVIQPWSHAIDLNSYGQPLDKKPHIGFAYAWCNKMNMHFDHKKYSSGIGHPGFAFAMRAETFNNLGGIISEAILGSGDRHFWMAMIDKVLWSCHPDVHPVYKKILKTYAVRARHYVVRNIGYLDGLITHGAHGQKANRKYTERWEIIVRNQFNPELDLKKDANGLYILTERNWRLRRDIMEYWKVRNEDQLVQ